MTTTASHQQAPAQAGSGVRSSFLLRHERKLVLLLCVLAAVRVFLYSAAFPFFSIVDEYQHLDTICRYAHGDIPRGIVPFCDESIRLIALFNTPEYVATHTEVSERGIPPPAWTLKPMIQRDIVQERIKTYHRYANTEATQPPVYYAAEGLVYDIGKLLGLRGGMLLYWLRLPNLLICALTVWLSYVFARRFCAASFMRLGLPLLIAVFPQDVYYSLNNDIPSALLFGASLYYLLRIYTEKSSSYAVYALAGILAAVAFLTKFSNFPILAGLAVLLTLRARWAMSQGTFRQEWPKVTTAILTCGTPAALWLARNYFVVGDLTGSHDKIQVLDWTAKPFGDIWQHPIFTLGGASTFWHETISNLWRGEMVWYSQVMSSHIMDRFYSVSSLILLISAATLLLERKSEGHDRLVCSTNAGMFALFMIFMIGMSVAFDFGECNNPTWDHPYFVAGRLISGGLIPFLASYLIGLGVLLERMRVRMNPLIVVAAISVAITVSEALLSANVFASIYNWYHML